MHKGYSVILPAFRKGFTVSQFYLLQSWQSGRKDRSGGLPTTWACMVYKVSLKSVLQDIRDTFLDDCEISEVPIVISYQHLY